MKPVIDVYRHCASATKPWRAKLRGRPAAYEDGPDPDTTVRNLLVLLQSWNLPCKEDDYQVIRLEAANRKPVDKARPARPHGFWF